MTKRVAVLGAGPMGLAAAYQLVLDGYRPVVYEADDRVGGMTAAFDFNGLTIERYYHFHCTSDVDYFRILKELNLTEKLHWVETKMGYWYLGKLQAWGNPFALLSFKGLGLFAKLRYGIHAFLCTRRNDWKPLDSVEATSWIKRWVGNEAYEVLWRRLFDFKFYNHANNLSAAWIWSRVRRIGRSRYNLFREKLGYLEGGSETLLQAMRNRIEFSGGKILLKSPVTEVVIDDGKIKGIKTGEHFEPYDIVISTIPLPYVPRIMPGLPDKIISMLKSVNNIAVVCIIVKLRRALTDYFWLNTNDPDMDIPGLVEYTNLRPLDQHIVYVPFYMPGEHPKYLETDQQFLDKVRLYLKKINPELDDEDFIDMRASRYRFAQPICEPLFREKLPPVKLPVEGLWLADTSYYYPEDRGISESIGFGRNMSREVVETLNQV